MFQTCTEETMFPTNTPLTLFRRLGLDTIDIRILDGLDHLCPLLLGEIREPKVLRKHALVDHLVQLCDTYEGAHTAISFPMTA